MRILYQDKKTGEGKVHICGLSGRQDFSEYEAHYKSRWLVRKGTTDEAIIFDGGQIQAKWARLTNGEVVQTEGKVVL